MKKYWKSPEELKTESVQNDEKFEIEHKNAVLDLFEQDLTKKSTSRRSFLKLWGYSLAAATVVSSCKKPIQKAIPYLIKPEEITPGNATFYASSFFDGSEFSSILVKTRDGRPIKIEGNELSGFNQGKVSARAQASVLSLYDDARYQNPLKNKNKTEWEVIDREIIDNLNRINDKKGKLILLTDSIISPSTSHVISLFREKFPVTEWIQYDAVSFSGMLTANLRTFGKQVIPFYEFSEAELIVSFGADFLGTWLAPVTFTRAYAKSRNLEGDRKTMSRHIQFESGMSLTGSNADYRYPIKPSDEWQILGALYNLISSGPEIPVKTPTKVIRNLAKDLLAKRGKSLVISGSNNVTIQMLVNKINYLLGNYDRTINLNRPMNIRKGLDQEMQELVRLMGEGKVDGIIFYGSNPVYNYPEQSAFIEALKKVPFKVSFSVSPDESSELSDYVCPSHHYLESWNDYEPLKGLYSLAQPTIHPVFNTRQAQESLLLWAGDKRDYHSVIIENWGKQLFKTQTEFTTPLTFWNHALQRGVYELEADRPSTVSWKSNEVFSMKQEPGSDGLQLCLYETVALGNGCDANNPWLQELPDPVTKACWDNYLTVSPKFAEENGLKNEDVVNLAGKKVPVFVQPGQAKGTVSLALGYGRTQSGKVGNGVGINAFDLVEFVAGTRQYGGKVVQIEKTGEIFKLALTQTHHSMEGRPIVRETSLESYLENPHSGNETKEESKLHNTTLYDKPEFSGHHWGLAVNLNSCTACGACIIACQAENNIPVIGKEEVQKRRIMHWIRIDRYYADEPEQPTVFHQPVMCQHCDNAPCENVCPVSATMHSNEGLNQVAYNRCIGTKYCINNCPYRVRRFNWFKYANNEKFDYNQNSDLGKLVLNPDVVIRERGVVEKCSFCVQRIQEKKLNAKLENRPLNDGEIQPACVQTCPSDALVFGDLNDPESKVSKLFKTDRNYFLLEDMHTLPSVGYLTKVRNVKNKAMSEHESDI